MNLRDKINEEYGKVPLCNGKRCRGIIINGFCLPLCWRCTSVLMGILIFFFTLVLMRVNYTEIKYVKPLVSGILFEVPILIDCIFQYKYKKESTNFKRFITGMLSGIGISIFAVVISNLIGKYIN
ncbi:DUF2085 domain-containing protein [Clostridium sp. 'White wine YQ']|uniref:DUF2085 domain-containing protein n=1 Tax=Clostridium sp. 'White wine YQ' TaxID=3027474 RepID=UPI00236659C4|nr:DUF2085 domain-containing protein [Clostridium sp. 'White wine YQ']MDD7794364.1 DUF2085 domain-containing protein [Clostridium sp. 'White wine YQ']